MCSLDRAREASERVSKHCYYQTLRIDAIAVKFFPVIKNNIDAHIIKIFRYFGTESWTKTVLLKCRNTFSISSTLDQQNKTSQNKWLNHIVRKIASLLCLLHHFIPHTCMATSFCWFVCTWNPGAERENRLLCFPDWKRTGADILKGNAFLNCWTTNSSCHCWNLFL